MDKVLSYIISFPEETQARLIEIRELILSLSDEINESIAYGMPAYKLCGKPLVYFGGFKNHIGLYATPSGHEKFKSELAKYKQGKGSVQFQNKEELPLDLIKRIVVFRIEENLSKHTE